MPVIRERHAGGLGSNPANSSPRPSTQTNPMILSLVSQQACEKLPPRTTGTISSVSSPLAYELMWTELYRGDYKNEVISMDPKSVHKKET